ncbi:MAG: CatA-like O-acetyltransferase [Aristaeellaceae bacterium]
MQMIDMTTWPRRGMYDYFSGVSNPFYSVTVQIDVTNLAAWARREGLSFYYALVYLCTQAVNRTEAFRYDIRDGQVALLDRREPSFTDLKPGAELFHIVTMPSGEDIRAFCREARQKSRAQEVFLDMAAEAGPLIYFSCLPWVELTALTNERDFDRDDTVPRIAWGRWVEQNGRLKLGLSLEVNHRFIDGLHIGQFVRALEGLIAALADK